mgnify:CR=1 FL=1
MYESMILPLVKRCVIDSLKEEIGVITSVMDKKYLDIHNDIVTLKAQMETVMKKCRNMKLHKIRMKRKELSILYL